MIITKGKPIDEILKYLEGAKGIFIAGCAQCATVCKTGGEDEVKKMKELLEEHGKNVVAIEVWDPPCHLLEVKKRARENKAALDKADVILSMSCGDGCFTIFHGTGKKVIPATDTLFLGEAERAGHFAEVCSLCGECTLFMTGGYCPNTFCPKGLQNGPCGGVRADGSCEVNAAMRCVWVEATDGLKRLCSSRARSDPSMVAAVKLISAIRPRSVSVR